VRRHAPALAGTIALLLCACGQPPARTARAAAAGTQAAANPGAFAQLGTLRAEANALKNPLAVYEFYRGHDESSDGALRTMLAQVLATSAAELGAYELAVREFPFGVTTIENADATLPTDADFDAVDAATTIADLARTRRIVLVNEAHHVAQTRLLTLALLPRLRALGFTHFAAEALDEHDRDLNERGYPTSASGTYVREPLYGEIVRTALRLGFVVVPYESANPNADADAREQEQASNLMTRVFDAQPQARLFVHAGYAHVHKHSGHLFGADPMALHLQRMSGSAVLSVDQTMLRPDSPPREYPHYRELLRRFAPRAPTALVAKRDAAPWSLEPRHYDVSVILPPSDHLVVGRPDWLALGGAREAVAIDLDVKPEHLPCVVEARYANESDKAIPADRVLVEQAVSQVVLFLRPGSYRLSASDATAHVVFARALRVEAKTR